MQVRVGEAQNEKVWYRSNRFFSVDGRWYFSTREGQDVGPFVSRNAANNGLNLYIRILKDGETSGLYAQRIATQGLWRSTLCH